VDRFDRSLWPWAARVAVKLAVEGDAGLGDTIARLAEGFGAGWLARMYVRVTGSDCGCGTRQERLNRRFPYRRESGSKPA